MSQTFVGMLFLAVSTSLPELTVSFTAVRIGAVEMSVGNILGSNVFNILIIFFADLFFRRGAVLAHASPNTLVACFFGLIMNAVLLAFLCVKPSKRGAGRMSSMSAALAVLYVSGMILLYLMK